MAIRQFVFCDICNPNGIRNIEQRRGLNRNKRDGRRIYDGRAWFEGELYDAVEKHKVGYFRWESYLPEL